MVRRDRGQLILVGAIAIALVLLGLVLIVNTALFTQVVGSEGTVGTAKSGGVTGQEVGDGLASVVADENSQVVPGTPYSTIDGEVTAESADLESALANRSVEAGGAFVSLEYLDHSVQGSSISQDAVGTFEAANGNSNWFVISDTNRTEVGGFSMVIHTDQSSLSSNFEMQIEGSGGDSSRLTVAPNGSGVDVLIDGPPDVSCFDVRPTNGTIHIDVSSSRVYEDGQCQFDAFASLEPGYSIEFLNADQVNGTYELATPSTSLLGNADPRFSSDADDPTQTPAVWAFKYSYVYDTPAATFNSTSREVEVYD